MGQITLFTRDGCPNCHAVKLDLKLCHLPFQEIVLNPNEIQQAPLIYFDNYPIPGGINELLDILRDWEVVTGSDGHPTLERLPSAPAAPPAQHDYNHHHHHPPAHHQQQYPDHHYPQRNDNNNNVMQDPHMQHPNSYPYSGGNNYGHCGDQGYHGQANNSDPHRGNGPHVDPSYGANDPYRDPYGGSKSYRDPHTNDDPHRNDPFGHPGQYQNNDTYGDPRSSQHDPYQDPQHRNGDHYRDFQGNYEDHDNPTSPYPHSDNPRHREDHRDPGYRDATRHEGGHRDESYQRNANYNDPYGQAHKDKDDKKARPGKDSRSIDSIQNRFHFRDNDEYKRSTSARDLRSRDPYPMDAANSTHQSRREQFQSKDSYQRHSFHGKTLRRQASITDKYTDDEDPFARSSTSTTNTSTPDTPASRREMFRKKNSYDRHSYHGKTLLEQHSVDSESSFRRSQDVASAATTTAPKRVARRELLQKNTSYDRHSFHGKTLLQQHQYDDNAASERGNDAADTTTTADRFSSRRDMFRRKTSYDRHSYSGKTLLQQHQNEDEDIPSFERKSPHVGDHDVSAPEKNPRRNSGSLRSSAHGSNSSHHSKRSIHIDASGDDASFSDVDGDYQEGEAYNENSVCGDARFDDGADDGSKDYSYCSAKDVELALSHLGGSGSQGSSTQENSQKLARVDRSRTSRSKSPSRNKLQSDLKKSGSLASLSPEDLQPGRGGEDPSEHSANGNTPKPTKVFSLGPNGSGLERLSRSFRQGSSKSLNPKVLGGKASSLRYLKSNDTTSSASTGLDSRAGRLSKSTRSTSPNPSGGKRSSRVGLSSGLKAARSAALMKSSLRLSNKSLNSSINSQGSTGSLWSNAQGAINPDEWSVELPLGNRVSILEATVELTSMAPLDNMKYNLTTYRNSFTGSRLTDVFQERFNLSRREAEDLGKSLCQAQILNHVCLDHGFSDTGKLFYRLQCHQSPEVLNSFCVWQDELSLTKNGSEVMDEIMGRLLLVMDAITDSVKGRVHYSRATKHHDDLVAELDYAICELQMVKLARMDRNTLLAFGLNVFQLFLHHAFIKVGIPQSSSAFHSFWTSLKFNVGGDLYSFSDWWNGICRGNRKGPHGPKPFQGKDSRCFLNLPDPVDPRIHFAAGMTHFMRPLVVYSGENIQGELEHVSRIYCKNPEFVWLEMSTNTMTLAPTIQSYHSDFASSIKGLPKVIMQWLPGKEKAHVDEMVTIAKKIKVEFSSNVKNDGWDEYAGEHFVYKSAPKADFKKMITSKKKAAPERKEVTRQGSLKSLFRLEAATAT